MDQETITDLGTVKVKRVLICCNGFINMSVHALTKFKEYYEANPFCNEDKEIVLLNLYDPADTKTYNRHKQYKVLENAVRKYAEQNYIIYLLGYSYTCGICARVATIFPKYVRKLILISPTLYLLKTKLLLSYIKTAARFIKMRVRHPKKSKKALKKVRAKGFIRSAVNIACSIVANRKYFKKVHCRVFVGKAQDDELCVGKTLWKITHKLETNKVSLKSYPEGGHTMIMHPEVGTECYDDILSFAFHIQNPQERKDEDEEKLATLSFAPIGTDIKLDKKK